MSLFRPQGALKKSTLESRTPQSGSGANTSSVSRPKGARSKTVPPSDNRQHQLSRTSQHREAEESLDAEAMIC